MAQLFKYSTVLVYCLLLSAVARAQAVNTAQIIGTVRDASGSSIPGAEIRLTQTATGREAA